MTVNPYGSFEKQKIVPFLCMDRCLGQVSQLEYFSFFTPVRRVPGWPCYYSPYFKDPIAGNYCCSKSAINAPRIQLHLLKQLKLDSVVELETDLLYSVVFYCKHLKFRFSQDHTLFIRKILFVPINFNLKLVSYYTYYRYSTVYRQYIVYRYLLLLMRYLTLKISLTYMQVSLWHIQNLCVNQKHHPFWFDDLIKIRSLFGKTRLKKVSHPGAQGWQAAALKQGT